MLTANGLFVEIFTCIDSAGVAAAPTGTPACVLMRNGVDTAVTVTVTVSGAVVVATCTIPSNATAGEWFAVRGTAVIAGTNYPILGESRVVVDVAGAILSTPANKLATNGSGQVTISNTIPTPPTASDNASAAAAAILATPANKLVTNGSGQVTISNTIPTPPTASDNASAAAAMIVPEIPLPSDLAAAVLVNPENKLATDNAGRVTTSNTATNLVVPLRAISTRRHESSVIELWSGELVSVSVSVVNSIGSPVDCTGILATLVVEDHETCPPTEIERFTDLEPVATVVGGPKYQFQFTATSNLTAMAGDYRFALRDNTDQRVIVEGVLRVLDAPAA